MNETWAIVISLIGVLAGVVLKHFFPQLPPRNRRRRQPTKKRRRRRRPAKPRRPRRRPRKK